LENLKLKIYKPLTLMYNLEMKIKDVTEVIEKIQLLSWKIYGNVK